MPSPKRYRPIRGVTWGIYLFLALGFVGLVVAAVVSGVMAERRAASTSAVGSQDPRACAAELAELHRAVHAELERQRSLSLDDAAAASGWAAQRTQLAALGARCQLTGGAATPLAKAYQKVVALQRLAESAAVQYRHEVGPTDAEAEKLLGEAGAAN